jgi:hypothetical protein
VFCGPTVSGRGWNARGVTTSARSGVISAAKPPSNPCSASHASIASGNAASGGGGPSGATPFGAKSSSHPS